MPTAVLRALAAFFVVAPLLLTGCGKTLEEEVADGGQGGPQSWTGRELRDGSTVAFPQVLAGKPAVLVFWATWCPYCKAFMPYTRGIAADYADAGVQIITFNAKELGEGDPLAYITSLNIPMVAIADADAIAAQYGVEYIPGLMVVDGSGAIIYQRGWTELPAGGSVARQWDSEVRQALDQELAISR